MMVNWPRVAKELAAKKEVVVACVPVAFVKRSFANWSIPEKILLSASSVLDAEEPEERHVFPIAKHPPVRLIPFANVLVPLVTFSAAVLIPPVKVLVAVVVAVKNAATTSPATESFA